MKKDRIIIIVVTIAFIISLMILLSGCKVTYTKSLVKPFIVTEVYPIHQTEKISEYLFKDVSGKVQRMYDDAGILNPKDTIHSKDLISYPEYLKRMR